jgi:DNA-binding MarR family transcriptional regulator
MAEYGLRSSHISCLYYLYKSESLTATELCEKCEEDKATISRSLEYLEENGYTISESKNARKYKSPIILSEKGFKAGKEIADKIDRVLYDISNELSDDERTEFYHSLTVISNGLDKMVKTLEEKE